MTHQIEVQLAFADDTDGRTMIKVEVPDAGLTLMQAVERAVPLAAERFARDTAGYHPEIRDPVYKALMDQSVEKLVGHVRIFWVGKARPEGFSLKWFDVFGDPTDGVSFGGLTEEVLAIDEEDAELQGVLTLVRASDEDGKGVRPSEFANLRRRIDHLTMEPIDEGGDALPTRIVVSILNPVDGSRRAVPVVVRYPDEAFENAAEYLERFLKDHVEEAVVAAAKRFAGRYIDEDTYTAAHGDSGYVEAIENLADQMKVCDLRLIHGHDEWSGRYQVHGNYSRRDGDDWNETIQAVDPVAAALQARFRMALIDCRDETVPVAQFADFADLMWRQNIASVVRAPEPSVVPDPPKEILLALVKQLTAAGRQILDLGETGLRGLEGSIGVAAQPGRPWPSQSLGEAVREAERTLGRVEAAPAARPAPEPQPEDEPEMSP